MASMNVTVIAPAFNGKNTKFQWCETDSMDQYDDLNVDSIDDLPDSISVYHCETDLEDSPMEIETSTIVSFRRTVLDDDDSDDDDSDE